MTFFKLLLLLSFSSAWKNNTWKELNEVQETGGGGRQKGGHKLASMFRLSVGWRVYTWPSQDGWGPCRAQLSSGGGGLTAPGTRLQLSAVWNTEPRSGSSADSWYFQSDSDIKHDSSLVQITTDVHESNRELSLCSATV